MVRDGGPGAQMWGWPERAGDGPGAGRSSCGRENEGGKRTRTFVEEAEGGVPRAVVVLEEEQLAVRGQDRDALLAVGERGGGWRRRAAVRLSRVALVALSSRLHKKRRGHRSRGTPVAQRGRLCVCERKAEGPSVRTEQGERKRDAEREREREEKALPVVRFWRGRVSRVRSNGRWYQRLEKVRK